MYFSLLPEISCLKTASAEKKKRRKKTVAGQAGQGNVRISAEIVLSIRTAYELNRKTIRDIMMMHPELREKYIRDIIEYRIRANLKVK